MPPRMQLVVWVLVFVLASSAAVVVAGDRVSRRVGKGVHAVQALVTGFALFAWFGHEASSSTGLGVVLFLGLLGLIKLLGQFDR